MIAFNANTDTIRLMQLDQTYDWIRGMYRNDGSFPNSDLLQSIREEMKMLERSIAVSLEQAKQTAERMRASVDPQT